MRHAVSMGMGT